MTPHALTLTCNAALLGWVGEIARLTRAREVAWCDGSAAERRQIVASAAMAGALLSESKRPSHVRRGLPLASAQGLDRLTFVCTPTRAESGSGSHWMAPSVAYRKLERLLRDSLGTGTLYVVPDVVDDPAFPQGRVLIELTNSYHGILSMGVSGRMGREALDVLGESNAFSRGLHVCLSHAAQHLLVCHFPEDDATWSVSS
ncbi:MAG TPA: hypothetical protein VI197_27180 [Polyangiaceae bacterium]